ncbi:oxepin-CoA hydrolase, alternative type [Xylophilus sp.]|uniref:oxepin-CoA hydrolase, alternative type n=1 Tax=Xylophilus sp. TaxID=2653893 RepID=UPI0013B69626|nr:enoyl-CoA hydratase [Xylophilus sp.]KAF1044945.1 MAG: 2,3-dehydroadipyl-CoA hydratase [Xylophilus sp.]
MPSELRSHHQGQTLVLTISNPEARNALGPEIYVAGVEALNAADANPEVRSVVITGAGGTFCAGGDLRRLLARRNEPPSAQAASVEALHGWIETIHAFPKPVIAAVEGAAAGAGFSLALACDLIVAARDAVFAAAYSRVALSPDGGASWNLARALPRQLAAELLLEGGSIGAQRLHGLGVVNRVAEPGSALQDALALAGRLNGRAPNALASIKELLADAPQHPLTQQLAAERDHLVANLHHANGGIGIRAFLDKQTPHFE